MGKSLMNNQVLVDTDILIDVSRNVSKSITYFQNLDEQFDIIISAVVEMELITGCRNKSELRMIDRFLNRYEIIKINESISEIAVGLLRKYRLSHGLLIADAIIAATAIYMDKPLASKNQKDYRFIEALELIPYP
jgi:hypothetical protein